MAWAEGRSGTALSKAAMAAHSDTEVRPGAIVEVMNGVRLDDWCWQM